MDEFLKFLQTYGPALLVLIISYFRDSAIVEKHKADLAELEKRFLEDKASVDKKYEGMSSAGVIRKQFSDGSGNA